MKTKNFWLVTLLSFTGSLTARTAQLPPSTDWVAPPAAARTPNPVPADSQSVARGKQLYQMACMPCHGAKGAGDGPAAVALERHPGVLSDPKMWQQTDGAVYWKTSQGRSIMPAFGAALTETQRWDVINYVRTLAPKPRGVPADVVEAVPASTTPKAETGHVKIETPPTSAPGSADEKYVTREEYNKLLTELANIKAQLNSTQTNVVVQRSENEQAFNDYDKQFQGVNALINKVAPGSTKMLLTGYGAGTFQNTTKGYGPAQPLDGINGDPRPSSSTFTADFAPIFLWQLNDRVLFESELNLAIDSGGASSSDLEYAQATYILNDYVTFGAGKFLNPMNYFVERLHPWWIDKLPDRPLAVFGGILPESVLGAEVRGGAPIGPTKVEYAFFVGNSPTLLTPDNDLQRGLVNFDDLSSTKVSPGGRVGFFPIPNLEVGYGFQLPNLGNGVGGLLQSVDLNYQQDCPFLKGTFDLKAQWAWSSLDPYTIDPTTGDVVHLPSGLNNDRNGGYGQLAYRPTQIKGFLKDLEAVFRYDMLNQSQTAVGYDERRYTMGLDYWFTASSVFKIAYDIDCQTGAGQNGQALILQYAIGF